MHSRPSILVVEDNPTEQKLIAMLLERYGYEATVVGSGYTAVRLIENGKTYSLILMDWQTDDMDGLECTREIRRVLEGNGGRPIPIVAVTARAMLGDKQKCLAAGMDDYLSKPYTPQDFEAMLRRWTKDRDATLTG